MKYRIRHTTEYEYSEPVSTAQNLVHLTPRDLPAQRRRRASLSINPAPHVTTEHVDYFGNHVTTFDIYQPHTRLTITTDCDVEVLAADKPTLPASLPCSAVRAMVWSQDEPVRGEEHIDAAQYLFNSDYIKRSPDVADYARPSFADDRPIAEAALDLTQRIHREFKYAPKTTTLATSTAEVLAERRGVCQDFAHLMIAAVRSLDLPARYVSGYLRTDPPKGKPRLVGADASHAWVSVYCPDAGWVDFDPTNGCLTSARHVVLAFGRDYADVTPIRGAILGGGKPKLKVSVDVRPVDDAG